MKERKQFGRQLYKFQGLAWMMADIDVAIESARHLVYKAAWKKQNHIPYTVDAARAKLHAANVAMDVTTKVVQLFGGYGDRKSTRLNSSHANISYAVFCLKKKQH